MRDDLAPSGVLRAAINLGNPVLAQGSPEDPCGVTVDLAYELAERLGLAARFQCFDAAGKSYEAMARGDADICFLAVDPDRAEQVAFTAPYIVIEGVYAVARESSILTVADVDRPGVRVGVKRGSVYDLHLSRTLRHATVVRGGDGVDVFANEQLEVAAGIREPMVEYLLANPHLRLVDGRFMLIRQAIGTTRARRPETVAYLQEFVEDVKASGFVAQSLKRSGQSPSLVAAPEDAV
ncbi:transporter substrate-binding domain-containing protein [Nocardioidaceae bacterium SCSIO 66511]|nr:transporter substrate-binding domain-containing protein [Nocardioidaceae bacterium SCSIO 66511]